MNRHRGKAILSVTVPVALLLALPTVACADQEAVSRACNKIYRTLCRDIRPGPEMLGQCFAKHPAIEARVPAKCTADFQINIENYNDAKAQGH